MLFFLSDLHLMDGTAGKYRIKAETFREIFKELALQASEAMYNLQEENQDLKLILLGDIFEIVRSESWFVRRKGSQIMENIDLEDRPWGGANKKTEVIAAGILDDILKENEEIISILSGKEWKELGFPKRPETIYIPGNHDRLCNIYPSLRERIIKSLDLKEKNPLKEFPALYKNGQYGVFARHGHEWDPFNFEGDSFEAANYRKTPIGDVIAAEIATKIPLEVERNIQHLNLSQNDQLQIADNFRHLFDVRPLSAIIPWLSHHVQGYDSDVQQEINKSFQQVGTDFLNLPYVQQWIDDHHNFWNPLDNGNKVKLLGTLFKTFNLASLEIPLRLYDNLKSLQGIWSHDKYISGAESDIKQLDKSFSYILYGHTHSSVQHTLEVHEDKGSLYLNTGTWRLKYYQALSKQGFTARNSITFTILYKKGEMRSGKLLECPTFETWTGAQSENE